MKKIERLSLNKLSRKELTTHEMSKVRGGENVCVCRCCYSSEPECNGDGTGYSKLQNSHANNCDSIWSTCDSSCLLVSYECKRF